MWGRRQRPPSSQFLPGACVCPPAGHRPALLQSARSLTSASEPDRYAAFLRRQPPTFCEHLPRSDPALVSSFLALLTAGTSTPVACRRSSGGGADEHHVDASAAMRRDEDAAHTRVAINSDVIALRHLAMTSEPPLGSTPAQSHLGLQWPRADAPLAGHCQPIRILTRYIVFGLFQVACAFPVS